MFYVLRMPPLLSLRPGRVESYVLGCVGEGAGPSAACPPPGVPATTPFASVIPPARESGGPWNCNLTSHAPEAVPAPSARPLLLNVRIFPSVK